MSPSIKLTYFPLAIRGEAIRLALHIGGIDFEDERISFEQLGAAKKAGMYPFGSLPVLTVDGEVYSQSAALLRFAGKLSGLYPKCEKDAMKVDMVVDATEDLANSLFKDGSEKGRADFVASSIPRYLGGIEKIYKAVEGPFLLGDTMTIADVKLAGWASWLNDGKTFDYVPAGAIDEYPHVMAATEAVLANQKVKEWYANH